ncbi:hypothetical protein JTE90_017088, partial [Oedothorax gibbosus]
RPFPKRASQTRGSHKAQPGDRRFHRRFHTATGELSRKHAFRREGPRFSAKAAIRGRRAFPRTRFRDRASAKASDSRQRRVSAKAENTRTAGVPHKAGFPDSPVYRHTFGKTPEPSQNPPFPATANRVLLRGSPGAHSAGEPPPGSKSGASAMPFPQKARGGQREMRRVSQNGFADARFRSGIPEARFPQGRFRQPSSLSRRIPGQPAFPQGGITTRQFRISRASTDSTGFPFAADKAGFPHKAAHSANSAGPFRGQCRVSA